jgi:TctA family transporter
MSTPSLPDVNTIVKTAKTYAIDLTERVIWTFLAAVASVALAAGPADMFNVSFWQAVGTAGVAAVVSLVKGLLARGIGFTNSASSAPRV